MKYLIFTIAICMMVSVIQMAAVVEENGDTSLHFDFKTENGQQRVEDIKYNNKPTPAEDGDSSEEVTKKPVEFRGGYSFISADGYEYTVKYKANKNGFQPYVTAHKLKTTTAT